MLDALGEGVTIHDADGEMVAANRAARKILRLEESELLSRAYKSPAWNITSPEGRPLAPDELPAARAIEDGRAVWNERIVVDRPDDAPVVLSVNAVPLGEETPAGWRAVVSFRDVTEERDAERRFERVFEQSPVGIGIVAPDGEVLAANQALADLLGYDRTELPGTMFTEFTHPEDREKDLDRAGQVVAGEIDGYQIRKRYVTRGDDVVWADLRVAALHLAAKDAPHLVGFATNVTGRRRLREELRARTERYERILTEISDVVTVLEEDGTIRYQSPSIEKVLGYGPDELLGRPVFGLVHPDDIEKVTESFFAAVESRGRAERTVQYRIRHADGSWRQVESTGVVPEDGTIGPVIATRDITERVQAQQKYRAIFSTTPTPVGIATLENGEFVEVNPAFEEMIGRSREELLGSTADEIGVWARPEQRDRVVEQVRQDGSVQDLETEFRDADGAIIDVLFSGSILAIGGEACLVGIAQDITERKEVEEALEHRALHDPLTGLPNRTLLSSRLRRDVARARRKEGTLGLLMIDIDQFKRVNDRLGHSVGDQVLVEFARRLEAAVREEDTVARWGGDEFFVVLPGLTGPERILDVPERLREAVRAPFEAGGESVHLGFTAGAVVYSETEHRHAVQTDDPEELIRFGSLALHWAREDSSAGYKLFDPTADVEGAAVIRQERKLRQALEKGEIVPHYQPVVRLADGAMTGLEALARWEEPERGLLPPAEFIPLAEELGLIGLVGETIIRQGCREVARWENEGRVDSPVSIGFNLSGQQFEDPDLTEKLERWVEEAGLRPEQVMLEVTETSLMQVPARIDALRESGFDVFVDDFGTGYSTFTYLRDLSLDGLKIDMSFVQGITESESDTALVETMVTLGHRLGLDVVAEGVETEGQRRKLEELGCRSGQGFLFARPVGGGEMGDLWRGGPGRDD